MSSAEERNRYIRKLWWIQGFLIQTVILFILATVAAPNTIYPIVLGFPFYVFWEAIIIALIGFINVTIWFKKIAKIDREQLRRGEEIWR